MRSILLTGITLLLLGFQWVGALELPKPEEPPPKNPEETRATFTGTHAPTATEEVTRTATTFTETPTPTGTEPTEPERQDDLGQLLENSVCASYCYSQSCPSTSISIDCFCQNSSAINDCVSNFCSSDDLQNLVQVLAYVCGM